jgi:hypothetical protein
MSNLYQDAILDAKALRASAMANAKAALEEAFEPKIQEMLRLKLSEELDEISELEEEQVEEAKEGIEEKKDEVEEVKHDDMKEEYSEDGMEETYDINEAELEEILAQLEELSAQEEVKHDSEHGMKEVDHDKMEETGYKDMKDESLNEADEMEEAKEDEEEKEEEEEAGEEAEEEVVDDETKVIDITLGDLKQVLQSVMAGQQDLGLASDEADADSEAEAEISLDEILAELEAEGMEDAAHRDPGHEAGHNKPVYPEMEEAKHEDDDKKKVEEELEEAKATIEKMRQDLQEVNLLNAKYLYMNKLFKAKSLSESQKVKVINALDRATTVNEVKNTYDTLKESFEAKTQLKESIGFASQAAGIAPKTPIIEQGDMMSRWQKLAGIKNI